jgi:hypothetical protein
VLGGGKLLQITALIASTHLYAADQGEEEPRHSFAAGRHTSATENARTLGFGSNARWRGEPKTDPLELCRPVGRVQPFKIVFEDCYYLAHSIRAAGEDPKTFVPLIVDKQNRDGPRSSIALSQDGETFFIDMAKQDELKMLQVRDLFEAHPNIRKYVTHFWGGLTLPLKELMPKLDELVLSVIQHSFYEFSMLQLKGITTLTIREHYTCSRPGLAECYRVGLLRLQSCDSLTAINLVDNKGNLRPVRMIFSNSPAEDTDGNILLSVAILDILKRKFINLQRISTMIGCGL